MDNPLISIVILNWNGEDILAECLESVLNTLYNSIEIIVIDNASTDQSLCVLKKYENRINLYKCEKNLGYAMANNIGFSIAKGEYVLTLNNDIIVEPTWLDNAIQHFKNDPKVGIISCRQMNYQSRETVDSLFHYLGKKLFCYRWEYGEAYAPIPASYVIAANGGSAIYRKQLIEEIGGFDPDFYAYHEEADLGLRALWAGWRTVYEPTAVVYHRGGHSFKKKSILAVYLHERNRYLMVLKNLPLLFIIKQVPLLLLYEINDFRCYCRVPRHLLAFLKARLSVVIYLFRLKWLHQNLKTRGNPNQDYFMKLRQERYIPL